ncbi:MAG: DUF58 domain-containing protein [Flavobacteriaceae bacterium]|nr:DUF58 domain-containing protein [Flavobacteriaceae bacterium]
MMLFALTIIWILMKRKTIFGQNTEDVNEKQAERNLRKNNINSTENEQQVRDLIKKVRQIEIKTKSLTNNLFMGEYQSSFKGRGMMFSEVRPYQYGDDVRNIDWNKTAQFNEPFVKVFEEERELTLMLMVDISASQNFGTRKQLKKQTVAEICATLAFSAMANNDKVGLLLYSDQVELYIPPSKGRFQVLKIIRELIEFKPKHNKTDLSVALDFLLQTQKRRSITFILSDFSDTNYEKSIRIAARKHEITGIRVYDEKEEILPNIGLVNMMDNETGEMRMINTSSHEVRKNYELYYRRISESFRDIFTKSGAATIEIKTDGDYIKALLNYFKSHHAA